MLSPRISSSAGKTSSQPSMRRLVAKLGPVEPAVLFVATLSTMSTATSCVVPHPKPLSLCAGRGAVPPSSIGMEEGRGKRALFVVVRPLQRFEVLVRLDLTFAADAVRD